MASVNKVILVGHLGKDPEGKLVGDNQTPLSKFSIATSEYIGKNADGTRKERTEWHNIEAWNKLADVCNQYLRKGTLVYIEGTLRTDKWKDEHDVERRTTKIICNYMQMLSSKSASQGETNDGEPAPAPMPAGAAGGEDPDDLDSNFIY